MTRLNARDLGAFFERSTADAPVAGSTWRPYRHRDPARIGPAGRQLAQDRQEQADAEWLAGQITAGVLEGSRATGPDGEPL